MVEYAVDGVVGESPLLGDRSCGVESLTRCRLPERCRLACRHLDGNKQTDCQSLPLGTEHNSGAAPENVATHMCPPVSSRPMTTQASSPNLNRPRGKPDKSRRVSAPWQAHQMEETQQAPPPSPPGPSSSGCLSGPATTSLGLPACASLSWTNISRCYRPRAAQPP